MITTADSYWVFDLDDTLYKEIDYFYSGVKAVENEVFRLFNLPKVHKKYNLSDDFIDDICFLYKLPKTIKPELLSIYRTHRPKIKLNSDVVELLEFLERSSVGVAILTDGRSFTQRQKIKSLELDKYPVYISEEYGLPKPNKERFEIINHKVGASHFVYVGDNPKKDFIAPNALGWKSIMIKSQGVNVHSQNFRYSKSQTPQIILNSIDEIHNLLC